MAIALTYAAHTDAVIICRYLVWVEHGSLARGATANTCMYVTWSCGERWGLAWEGDSRMGVYAKLAIFD